jgi:hypothetical protein
VKFATKKRSCCGHSIEVSYDGYCTVLTCECVCRRFCLHLQVTVPGEARRDEREGRPLYGWCRDCRAAVDDPHIRSLRPQRDARTAVYWLSEADDSTDELRAIAAAADLNVDSTQSTDAVTQLNLF